MIIPPINLPPDPLGWRWWLAGILASVPFIVPLLFLLRKDVTGSELCIALVLMVVWSIFLAALRGVMEKIYLK